MSLRSLIWCLVFASTAVCSDTTTLQSNETQACRCFPGDACWPSTADWHAFNQTVGGKLIKNIPLASVCHQSEYGSYDAKKCDDLKSNWFFPETHLNSIGSIMVPLFAKTTAATFSPRKKQNAHSEALFLSPSTLLAPRTSRRRSNSYVTTISALWFAILDMTTTENRQELVLSLSGRTT